MPRPQLTRRADGRYRCKYEGKYFYGHTQTEAYRARDEYVDQLKAGVVPNAGAITVADYAAQWVVVHKAQTSIRTYNEYIRFINIMCSVIGGLSIRDVRPTHIKSVYNTRNGFSASEIKHLAMVVRGVFQSAVADRLITYNPCTDIAPPRGTAGTHRALEPWERVLIHEMGGHKLHPCVMLMLYAGLRRGEALALDIDRDVDFKKHTLTIREAVHFNSNKPVISTPKTKAGLRTIPILAPLEAVLSGLHGLAAPSPNGSHMTITGFRRLWSSYITQMEQRLNGNVSKRWYGKRKDMVDKQLPPWRAVTIRAHDLRHTFCTMLYELGIDVKTAMFWMGHADMKMTMQIYTHLSNLRRDAISQKMQADAASFLDTQKTEATAQFLTMGVNSGVNS